jgi:hypothetical protein
LLKIAKNEIQCKKCLRELNEAEARLEVVCRRKEFLSSAWAVSSAAWIRSAGGTGKRRRGDVMHASLSVDYNEHVVRESTSSSITFRDGGAVTLFHVTRQL